MLSRQVKLWHRLIRRFALEPIAGTSTAPLVSTIVTPVTDADDVLRDVKADEEGKSLTGASGTYIVYWTVPTGKKWRILWFAGQSSLGNSGAASVIGGATVQLQYPAVTGGFVYSSLRLILKAGDTLGRTATGNAGDTSVNCDVVYEEEDLGE